ncbi:MAG TPA: PTS sugar transporter subunit IIA [Rubricoccaceae bacterium]|nr:PTS sugar transporter subunit IIA [Rubricoccaceae bacterium]
MLHVGSPSVSDLLGPGRVCVGLPGKTKDEIIEGVVALLRGAPAVRDLEQLRDDVRQREEVMSTGVGKGLALPHARTAAVTDTVAAFAITTHPVDYGALDGEPVRLVFLAAGPEEERGAHVRLLSRISRLMSDDAFRARLLAARSEAEILAAFRAAEEHLG